MCGRISDIENASGRSPSESIVSMQNNSLKMEPTHRNAEMLNRYSPIMKIQPNPCDLKHNFNVPIFALHAKGSFYIPLTIDYKTLLPFLQSYDLLEVLPSLHNVTLHPVTLNVNFHQRNQYDLTNKYTSEYVNNSWQ